MKAHDIPPLGAEARVAIALRQLEGIAEVVESHGAVLGMLHESLMSLVERHRQEAAGAMPTHGGSAAELTADHETMLMFREPLGMVCQFHDRLRQRIEHVRAVLAPLPAAPPSPDQLAGGELLGLFPFDEERAVNAALAGVPDLPSEDVAPEVEIF